MGKFAELAEKIPGIADEESRRHRAADHIAGRTAVDVNEGRFDIDVRGGLFNFIATIHDRQVYSEAAGLLEEQGIEIEVHRYRGSMLVRAPDGPMAVEVPAHYDMIKVTSLGGAALERPSPYGPQHSEHEQQLYP